jgi:hypothetical protein
VQRPSLDDAASNSQGFLIFNRCVGRGALKSQNHSAQSLRGNDLAAGNSGKAKLNDPCVHDQSKLVVHHLAGKAIQTLPPAEQGH